MECKDFEPSIIQENRVLRLCKRLDKFTLDEISTIAEDVDEAVLELLLFLCLQQSGLCKWKIISKQRRKNIYKTWNSGI